MSALIHIIGWGILSAVTMLFMAHVTEKRGEDHYRWNWCNAIVFVLLMLVSMAEGYVVYLKAVSLSADIRLTASYFLILGAAVIDWKLHIIPNFIPGLLVLMRLLVLGAEIFAGGNVTSDMISSFLGALLCGAVLAVADKASKGGIGKGDVKLLMAHGFMCGIYIVFSTLLLSLICCAVISTVLVMLKKCTMKDHLAFGPFIYMGYAVMLFFALY